MRKKVGIIKRMSCLLLIFLLSINSFAAIVSDNDGSAFITKSEFDALKSSFQSQIDSYNNSIDSKIDVAIASYLAGIKLTNAVELNFYDGKGQDIVFWNKESSTEHNWTRGLAELNWERHDSMYYDNSKWMFQLDLEWKRTDATKVSPFEVLWYNNTTKRVKYNKETHVNITLNKLYTMWSLSRTVSGPTSTSPFGLRWHGKREGGFATDLGAVTNKENNYGQYSTWISHTAYLQYAVNLANANFGYSTDPDVKETEYLYEHYIWNVEQSPLVDDINLVLVTGTSGDVYAVTDNLKDAEIMQAAQTVPLYENTDDFVKDTPYNVSIIGYAFNQPVIPQTASSKLKVTQNFNWTTTGSNTSTSGNQMLKGWVEPVFVPKSKTDCIMNGFDSSLASTYGIDGIWTGKLYQGLPICALKSNILEVEFEIDNINSENILIAFAKKPWADGVRVNSISESTSMKIFMDGVENTTGVCNVSPGVHNFKLKNATAANEVVFLNIGWQDSTNKDRGFITLPKVLNGKTE